MSMSERFHVVTIGDEEVRLRLTIAALHRAQKQAGQPLAQLLSGLVALDLVAILYLLRAAREWERPRFSLDDAEKLLQQWIDGGADMEEVAAALATTSKASGILRDKPAEAAVKSEGGEGREDSSAPKAEASS